MSSNSSIFKGIVSRLLDMTQKSCMAWPLTTLLAFSLIRLCCVPCPSDTQKHPACPQCTVNLLHQCYLLRYSASSPPLGVILNIVEIQFQLPSLLPVLRNLNLEDCIGLQMAESLIQSGSNNKRFVFSLKKNQSQDSSIVNSMLN